MSAAAIPPADQSSVVASTTAATAAAAAANDPHHTYPQVAQKIIETLNGLLHPEEPMALANAASAADLEIILDMIQVNLTFDDPGIFFSCPTPQWRSRQMQRHFNRWLHHQIVYIVAHYQSEALRKKAGELQLEMLQASLLKQRWLFAEIVARYAALLAELCSPGTIDWARGLPHRLWTDAMGPDASPLSTPNHSRLEVTSFAMRDTLATNCLHLLTHAVALCANTDERLVGECAEAALAAFGALGLAGKTAALQFFTKLLRRKRATSCAGDERRLLHRLVPQLLQGIQQTHNQIPVWLQVSCGVRAKDVKRFGATVGYLLGQVKELPAYCVGEHNYAVCVQMCSFLLTGGGGGGGAGAVAVGGDEDVRAYFAGKFAIAVVGFFGRVLRLNAVRLERDLGPLFAAPGTGKDWWQRGGLEADVVQLLQCSVRDRLQRPKASIDQLMAEGGDELDEGDGDEVFRLVDELADWALRVETMSETLFMDKLRLANTLVTMLLAAEHEFQLWHQDQHHSPSRDDGTCAICTSAEMLADDISVQLRQTHRQMRSTITTLASRFLQLATQAAAAGCLSSADSVFELADIGWRLFGSEHSRRIDQPQQQQLLALAMATLVPTNAGHNDPLGAAIATIVNATSAADRRIFHEHLTHTILATDLHQLQPALAASVVQQFAAIAPDTWSNTDAAQCWLHLWLQIELPIGDLMAASVARWTPGVAGHNVMVAQLLRPIVCMAAGDGWSVVTVPDSRRSQLCCERCDASAAAKDDWNGQSKTTPIYGLIQRARHHHHQPAALDILAALPPLWLPAIFSATAAQPTADTARLLAAIDCLPALAAHCPQSLCTAAIASVWLPVCCDPRAEVQQRLAAAMPPTLAHIRHSASVSAADKRALFERLFVQLSAAVTASLTADAPAPSGRAERQAGVVRVLTAVGTHSGVAEVTVLQVFLLQLLYLVRTESECAKTAALGAYEMCRHFGCTLRTLVAWHRDRVFAVLTAAAIANCLQSAGVLGLHQTLSNFCHLLGYQNWHTTFMPHYCGALLAQLLPWRCQRRAECDQLVEELCTAQNKSRAHVMQAQFLHVYLWVSLRVTAEAERAECVAYLLETSGLGLVQHLKADSRRTLNEILVWYHRSPEFVMQTLRQLIGDSASSSAVVAATTSAASSAAPQPLSAIADYIAARFLGVLNYFGVVLVANDLDKSLQAEMLLSLGAIIRFMGAAHITPFRFKILTVLRSVLAIENRRRLRGICAAVWKIFIYTVDAAAMGPLLSIVVVFLEPLMLTHAAVVDEMLRYLIIANGSLLSRHINDLFFVERTAVCAEVKEFVAQHARDAQTFETRFALLSKQIAHENIDVRVYALQYLRDLLDANRRRLNALIVGGQPAMSPLVEQLLGALLEGSRHEDAQLQLAAGRCLGRIGALEPSHLPPNYAPQKRSALGIHTDIFATMALAELCRAYQFQKDTKRVDGFSLAIQEILLARGVCPEAKKKMNVWNAIPERMRQLMQPLLKSCYTALPTGVQPAAHPIFSPGRFATAESWACAWATRLTDMVEDEDTKHLLKSFKTSLRNDGGVLAAFMPYIVLHAVQTCSPANAERIAEELHCVFRHVLDGGGGGDHSAAAGGDGDLSAGNITGSAAAATSAGSDELAIKCAKIAFNQLEFLGSWLRQYGCVYANSADDAYRRVAAMLRRFDARLVAAANFRCGEYARALQYLEVYVEERRDERLQPELSFLAQIYAELLDADSLGGALQLKAQKPTLAEQVLLHNATGRLQESTVCFEQMLQAGAMTDAATVDMIQCYLGLDQPETALMVSEALMRRMDDRHVPSEVYACSAEPLWRLGRFEELDELLDTARLRAAPDWGVRCGQVLLALRHGDRGEFGAEVERCHASVLRELRAHDGDELGSYDKVYELVLRLHRIAEIEMCEEAVGQVLVAGDGGGGGGDEELGTVAVRTMRRLFEEWDARLELLRPTAKILEPVLCLRRVLLTETKSLLGRRLGPDGAAIGARLSALINTYLGESLMRSTELARQAEMYQQAQLFILNAESYAPAGLFIEKAKLAWSRGDQAASLITLERGIDELRARLLDDKGAIIAAGACAETQSVYAESKFLVATYNADSMNTNTALNIKYFKEAMQAAGDSEKCYVFYAQYLEKVYAALTGSEQLGSRGNDSQQEIMTCYGKSMAYGCRYIYQSMPRFLSIWLDFTARPSGGGDGSSGDSHRRVSQNMTKIVDHFAETLPPFVFFTAFSQLVSRICHPSAEVYAGLKTIIIRLIKSFTQQSMWMIMSVYKSSYASRVKRCTEIFSDRRLAARDLQKLINDFNLLAERMIELTNKPTGSGAGGAAASSSTEKLTVSAFYRELPALLRTPGFSAIILPINKYMLPVLPAADQRDRPANAFQAFPEQAVHIAGCRDELVVMPSLQKPKRIALMGSDGRDYMIMMKPKDDLRKDFRLMEFNAIVNRYLRQDAEARQRRLYIRTYAVLPLNEECGIIEWLPNLQALRPIVIELLKRKSLGVSSRELRELYRPARDATAKRQLLLAILIPRHPPQLAEWYKERFSSAHNWYLARSSFVRTTAVISLVGYILGLGDRHGENILFDTGNGDSVHVDFNCLFNKGECFEVPELVPFRLTHNMVHAMGPLGVEGAYRQCAQITLRVLREQQATLMSVLRPFVYDPLVSWNRVMSKSDGRQERTDTQAITNVKRIEERLRGYVKQNGVMGTMALSSEGVVNHCIAEATDVDKLAAMYMGWGSFI